MLTYYDDGYETGTPERHLLEEPQLVALAMTATRHTA